MIKTIIFTLLGTLSLTATHAHAIMPCSTNKQLNDYNQQIILGISDLGNVREAETLKTGSGDDNSQLSGQLKHQYNQCGELMHFFAKQKTVGKYTSMEMVFNGEKTADGWQIKYDVSVQGLKDGKSELIYQKIGNPIYYTDKNGKITHSQDNFIANGEKGVTKIEYRADADNRLISYLTSGDDKLMNGISSYFYNDRNLQFSSVSPNMHSSYTYDQQGRDLQMIQLSVNSYSLLSTKAVCLEWDKKGNCRSSTTSEIEIYPNDAVKRGSVIKTNISYWAD